MSSLFHYFGVKFPYFSSLFKIPQLFPALQKFSYFSRFSSPCGSMILIAEIVWGSAH